MNNHKFVSDNFNKYETVRCVKCEYCAALTLSDALKIFIGGIYHVKSGDFIILYRNTEQSNQVYLVKTYGCTYTDSEYEIRQIIK